MFAGVFVIAAMGIVTYLIFALMERHFTHWATRREQTHFGGG
jgi:NitT/TauT family transport system permease protein